MRCWELQAEDSGMSEVEVCTVKGRLDKCGSHINSGQW